MERTDTAREALAGGSAGGTTARGHDSAAGAEARARGEGLSRFSALRRVGCAATAAALVASCALPAAALAADNAGSSASATTATMTAASDGGAGGAGGTPPDGEGGGSKGTPPDGAGGGAGGGGGANTQTFDYDGTYAATLTADGQDVASSGETVSATDASTNAALVQNGGTLALSDAVLQKSGDVSDGDSCNFYGVNSILLAVGESSMAIVDGAGLSASSEGSNGIFSTDGATVLARDVSISTSADNSRGLDATYAGTVLAGDVTVDTQGDHCAAFATDRGGGYISVYGAGLSTAGSGSPLLYSTGAVEVDGVTGTASGSQIAGMEGLNTIRIYNSSLTSTVTGKTASDPVANGVIIYQSTSGDADTSTGQAALFQVSDSTLSSAIESGALFYLTNTTADVVLENTTLDFDAQAANLITVAGNDANNWGSAGSNGAVATLTGIGQQLAGTVEVDTVSTLAVYLTEGTTWEGQTSIVENSAASTSDEPLSVSVDATSTWVVTGDCTVSNLNVAAGGAVVDENGDAVTVVANGQTVVAGEGSRTVTVTGTYTAAFDGSGAVQATEASIDRTAYDEQFGTDTTLGAGTTTAAAATPTTASSAATEAASTTDSAADGGSEGEGFNLGTWLAGTWEAFLGLFGL